MGGKFAPSPKSKTGSISPFGTSPKATFKQYQLTADSLELYQLRQRRAQSKVEENKDGNKKKGDRRQRNRSKSFFVTAKDKQNGNKSKKAMLDKYDRKINDDVFVFAQDDDEFFDDEVS